MASTTKIGSMFANEKNEVLTIDDIHLKSNYDNETRTWFDYVNVVFTIESFDSQFANTANSLGIVQYTERHETFMAILREGKFD